jgi:hypothetical protein
MSIEEIIATKKVEYDLGDTDEDIYKKCVKDLEGICDANGYILPGNTTIEGRSFPVNMLGNGKMITHIRYRAKVGIIRTGDEIEVQVKKVTKGVGSLASVIVNNNTEIGTIILPDDIQDPGKKGSENESLRIKVLTCTFAYGWDMIRGVGKII